MNVPPVAATQTEWRTCVPPGGYSLQCFNDSDTELSTAGTPISDKVQMIIESLRSTQSSLEMGDEIEGNVLSGQSGHPQVCRVAMGSYVGAKSKTKGSTENQQTGVSSPVNHGSSDSDSDDSVDRGIEEAIREYLKEKDDHKRKAEPCSPFLQSSKIPRKNLHIPEASKQNSDSNTFISNNQFPKSVKVETLTTPAVEPIKKYIKNKASLSDNMVTKLDSSKSTSLQKEQTKSPSKTVSLFNIVKSPVKVEEDSNDSSSDDGIEEAIQRYQLEKKEQQNKREDFNPHAFKEDSDSTSDDGIEEAIRCYQLEQLKEKSALKPFLHKQKPFSKSLIHAVECTSMGNMKKHKLRKKKTRTEKEVKSVPLSVVIPNTFSGKGNGLLSFKLDSLKEQPTPIPPKINTTAELMCAEAILDISKTVMPGAFHQNVGLSSCVPAESSLHSSPLYNCPDRESDDSSIDSEDGIEQEIRKFLEQKAQMHKQPPTSAVTQEETQSINELEKVKAKQVATQKKPQRLSLTQRRKHKEENSSISNVSGLDNNVKETAPKPLPDHRKDSSPLVFSRRSPTHPTAGLFKTEQSGDKSSSLDSDEDLDTAIRDLLKTKKKSKKKTRDLKRKSMKCLREEEPLLKNVLQTKKLKPDPLSKSSALRKTHKSKDDIKDKSGTNQKNISQHKQPDKNKVHSMHGDETETVKETEDQETVLLHSNQTALQVNDDSSSVDSDDSIEQEIRRFLAEKAKVSTAEKSKEEDASRNGTVKVCTALHDEDHKQENQLAEIQRKSSTSALSGKSPLISPPQDRSLHPTPESLLPDISNVGAQSHLSSAQSCSPTLLEPADGAGAARTDQRRPSTGRGDVQDVTPQMEKVKTVFIPNIAHSRSESIKWCQSLGLPTTDARTLSRTPFHITSSKINKTASANPLYQSINLNSQPPGTAWSSARTSRSPFSCSTETTAVNTPFRSSVLNLSTASHPRMAFAQSLLPGHSSQCPVEGETESMVHISKDKSVFVELESNRTNHVQVRSRERSEGKERVEFLSEKKEVESLKINNKQVHLERTEEEFVDEAECESGNRRNPETKQGFSTL